MQAIIGNTARKIHSEAAADVGAIRDRVDDVLNRLAAQLIARVTDAQDATVLQKRVAWYGQIAAGLAIVDPECLPATAAGFGSTVDIRDVETGERQQYTLMVGSLIDVEANQVSLASPIGSALLGRVAGDEIVITTPQKRARLVITSVVTLMEALDADETNTSSN